MDADAGLRNRERLTPDQLVLLRVRRFTRFRVAPAVYGDARPVEVAAWAVGGEPVPFAAAIGAPFEPFAVGSAWGRPWDTVWFDVRGEVPEEWGSRAELVVDLGFTGRQPGFQAEALVHRPAGSVVKAVQPRNAWVPIPEPGPFRLLIEAAANPVVLTPFEFEPTPFGDPETAGAEPVHRLRRLEVARREGVVWELLQDITVLDDLVDVLPQDGRRRADIIAALDRAVDTLDPEDVAGTAAEGRRVLAPVLERAAPASALTVHAVGHAHIDSAWLWPVREARRKVARTFSNVLALAEEHTDLVFAASSAQHYAWLKESYPGLLARVRQAVAEGTIVPVGGMWVESDTNMPGGESIARQLVHGKRFFLDEFGVESDLVWLPDSFGYSAALPQIIRAAGSRFFVTQKASWNETNAMPHSTFLWEGIDGSRVFTHLPPAETYNSDLGASDLQRSERVFAEKGSTPHILGLFGWGDGGGGPTREMLAAATRKRDLDGSPTVRLADPHAFFALAEADLPDPAVWLGEIYLELHRGTLTSQQRTKRGNRRSEALLREAELWAATAAVRTGAAYPHDALDALWRTVLLHQFHDILPGSSIAWVYREAEAEYARVEAELEALIGRSLRALAGGAEATPGFANAGPLPVRGVPALGVGPAEPADAPVPHPAEDEALRVEVDRRGAVVSLRDGRTGREVVPDGTAAGVLQLLRDTPREWDAWDINEEDQRTGRDLLDPEHIGVAGNDLVVVHRTASSRIELRLRLAHGRLEYTFDIDWQESQKLLKLAFPLDLRTDRAAAETQFGHVHRPIHRNTSWDSARFEVVAHRWMHVGEPGFGVAIANSAVYGHDVRTTVSPSGRPMVVARLSILRAATYPDPRADRGRHRFAVTIRPGGIAEAIEDGYALHLPLRPVTGAVEPLLRVDDTTIVVESVKLADDGTGDLVVRLYESRGGRASGSIGTAFAWTAVETTDLLERPVASTVLGVPDPGGRVAVELRPFELATLRFRRG